MLGKQSWFGLLAWMLILVPSAVLLGCSSPDTTPTGTAPGVHGSGDPGAAPTGSVGESTRAHLTQLGVIGGPSQTDPRGLVVTGFVPSSRPSPVQLLGVEEGDVIVSCNGQVEQMGVRLIAAIEGLHSRGEPVVLEVVRDGKRIKLETTERLPAPGVAPDAE